FGAATAWRRAGAGDTAGAGAASAALRALRRGGRVVVSSFGEQNTVSLLPVGRTSMKSPSAGSPIETIFAEPPTGTPTAAAVNHTGTSLPFASSSRSAARSRTDSAAGTSDIRVSPALT